MIRPTRNAQSRGGFWAASRARFRSLLRSLWKEHLPQLSFFVALLIFLGGLFVFLAEVGRNRDMFGRLFDSIWWAVVTIFTVGYGDRYPITPLGRVMAMVLILMGVVATSILSGTVASIFVDRKIREGKGLQEINLRNHCVICGWSLHAEAILEGLARMADGGKCAVVLVNEMDPEQFQSISAQFPGLDLRFVRGDFVNEKVLKRAALGAAGSGIIVSDTSGANTSANADDRAILAALAIKALNPELSISAELANAEKEQHLRRAGVDHVLVDGEFNAFLLASSIRSQGIPQLAREILSFESRSFIRQAAVPASLVGKSFAELSGYYLQNGLGVLIGFLSEEKKMSLDDILSAGSSAIDAFIKQKFAEAQIDVLEGQKQQLDIRLNPGADYIVKDTDVAFLIGAAG
jgi:voltage-gated potassium channel